MRIIQNGRLVSWIVAIGYYNSAFLVNFNLTFFIVKIRIFGWKNRVPVVT